MFFVEKKFKQLSIFRVHQFFCLDQSGRIFTVSDYFSLSLAPEISKPNIL